MNETPANESQRKKKVTPLRIALGLAIVILLVANLIELPLRTPSRAYIITCKANLRILHDAFTVYAQDNDGTYPTPAQWCDLIKPMLLTQYDGEGSLYCPKSRYTACDYAMNPHADPCSPPDVVLLFESQPGWNQFGGADLLRTDNHKDVGANVIFVSGEIISVTADQVADLRWTVEEPNQPDTD